MDEHNLTELGDSKGGQSLDREFDNVQKIAINCMKNMSTIDSVRHQSSISVCNLLEVEITSYHP